MKQPSNKGKNGNLPEPGEEKIGEKVCEKKKNELKMFFFSD